MSAPRMSANSDGDLGNANAEEVPCGDVRGTVEATPPSSAHPLPSKRHSGTQRLLLLARHALLGILGVFDMHNLARHLLEQHALIPAARLSKGDGPLLERLWESRRGGSAWTFQGE